MPKRNDYISWDEYFMGVAMLSAYRSKDPNTRVGACIVSDANRIMSVGYNGFPIGVSNEFADEHAEISVRRGALLVTLCREPVGE